MEKARGLVDERSLLERVNEAVVEDMAAIVIILLWERERERNGDIWVGMMVFEDLGGGNNKM